MSSLTNSPSTGKMAKVIFEIVYLPRQNSYMFGFISKFIGKYYLIIYYNLYIIVIAT